MDYKEVLLQLLLEKINIKESETLQSDYIGKICMVRTYSAGVFYGKLVKKVNTEARIENARRVWCWNGANSLSELAEKGTSKPELCKFPCPVSSVELTNVIEVIPMTEAAIASLNGVKIWQ